MFDKKSSAENRTKAKSASESAVASANDSSAKNKSEIESAVALANDSSAEKQQHQNNCKCTTSAKWQSAHVNMPHNIAFLCLVKLQEKWN